MYTSIGVLLLVLDGVTSFLRLKDVTNTCKRMRHQDNYWRDLFSAMGDIWKKLNILNVFSSYIVCYNRNRSALMRELLSNNALFVGQLYEDKSVGLCAQDLILSTTDFQTVRYYSTIHCYS